MQGRSFKNDEVVQEITDESRIFKMLGADRLVVHVYHVLFLNLINLIYQCF